MSRRSRVQNFLYSEAPIFRMSCIKKRKTARKTPQEEARDVAQQISQEARKTRHEEQKQTAVNVGVGCVKQDAAQDTAAPRM